jgi:hypothetical protein
MCFGGRQKTPNVAPPTPPPAPAPVQKLEPTKPPTATPAPEQPKEEKATLKKKDTGSKKRERLRTGTASLQTAPGQGLNIGGGS